MGSISRVLNPLVAAREGTYSDRETEDPSRERFRDDSELVVSGPRCFSRSLKEAWLCLVQEEV